VNAGSELARNGKSVWGMLASERGLARAGVSSAMSRDRGRRSGTLILHQLDCRQPARAPSR
jgi:hypothetical protein